MIALGLLCITGLIYFCLLRSTSLSYLTIKVSIVASFVLLSLIAFWLIPKEID